MSVNDKAKFDEAWDRHITMLRELGPELAAAKRAILADAARRGLMNRVTFVDIGLPSGELWPVVPQSADAQWTPDIAIQGDLFRQRR